MLYAHYFRTINCSGVQSLDSMVHVEVEPGKDRPYKNTMLEAVTVRKDNISRLVAEYPIGGLMR
jgi:hypothetical protein